MAVRLGVPDPAKPEQSPDLMHVNRAQEIIRTIDVEELIPANHPARLFWEILGGLDLSAFYNDIKTKRGCAGRPTFDPRRLISIWLYAYQRGIGSAREIERMCGTDPGMQWLTGWSSINHHSLSDFRVQHDQALTSLFEQVLGMLTLKRLTGDAGRYQDSSARAVQQLSP